MLKRDTFDNSSPIAVRRRASKAVQAALVNGTEGQVFSGNVRSDSMPWTKPLTGKARIDAAGDVISGRRQPSNELEMDTALDIAGNWRSSHGYPLHVVWTSLRNRASKVDSNAVVPKRLKRLPSVVTKLSRFQSMQLSKMQDLGGCRAVLRSVKEVDKLVAFYQKHPSRALEFIKKYDYINDQPGPKHDGYRSVHLVYKYQGNSQNGAYKGLKIEIQIRSRLQHAWATALEVIDTFTGQGLKANLGDDDWKRFFALIGTAMALKEKRPIVPGTPNNFEELVAELRTLCDKLRVTDMFLGLSAGVSIAPRLKFEIPTIKAETYIMTLNSETKIVHTVAYATNKEAETKLLELEKENFDKPHIQSVMASAQSLEALRTAYPNYYLDTKQFVRFLERRIKPKESDSASVSDSD
jgi:hypothetical protein